MTTPAQPATDSTGRTFVSYRRTRREEAESLLHCLHEVGIPTWQDLSDLDEVHTATELRQVLRDPTTAGAVVWLTPEVDSSPTIRRIEVPEILRREQADDGFFVVPVAAGGLDYGGAARLVNDQLGVHDLSTWNMLKVREDPAAPSSVFEVARRVLRRRIRAVHRQIGQGEALRIRFSNRHPPGFQTGWTSSVDWSRHFRDRHAEPAAWHQVVLPAIETLRETLRSRAPGRPLEFSGSLTLSAGLALGRAFSSLDPDLRLAWRQAALERPDQLWSLAEGATAAPVDVTSRDASADGETLAVLLSLTTDVEPAYGVSKADFPKARCLVRVRPPWVDFQPVGIESPGQATDLVERVVQEIGRARELYRPSRIDLFAAIPLGLAVLLGQRLNTLGPVQTYEHVEDDSVGRYRPEVLLASRDR